MLFKSSSKEIKDVLPPYTPIEYKWNLKTLFLGFTLGLGGIKNTLTHEKTRNKLLRDTFLFLIVSFMIYITGQAISIPFHALKLFKIFGFSNAGFLADSINKILFWVLRIYPQVILLVIRYIYPKYLDDLFFESFNGYPVELKKDDIPSRELLSALDYARQLSKCKPSRSYARLMFNYFKRLLKKFMKGSLVYILISIPGIGKLILPAMLVMAISQFIPFNISCGIGVVTFFSSYVKKLVTAILFNCIFGIRTMNREVLEPYFCRVKMSSEEKTVWFKTYEPLLFGFMAIFYILFLKPWYGPLFFALAQGAIPTLLVEIFKYHQPTLKN